MANRILIKDLPHVLREAELRRMRLLLNDGSVFHKGDPMPAMIVKGYIASGQQWPKRMPDR